MLTRRQLMGRAVLAAGALLCARSVSAQEAVEVPFPPHRIIGNVHYVGSEGQASYLITSKEGHILINSSFAETVPLIRASVEKLGFKFSDVKILLTSHAHSDHVAGSAAVRKLTNARVLVMEGDEEIVRTGGKGDFQYQQTWEPCPVDQVLHDGEVVKLGGNRLTARKTAGHTRGCTTWTWDVEEGGKSRHVVVIGSPNVNAGYKLVGNAQYPGIAEDYKRTFKTLKSLPCDVFLGAHGAYYDLPTKYARLSKEPGVNPFIDPDGYQRYVADREAAFRKELAAQQHKK